jgi:hypothetical protein
VDSRGQGAFVAPGWAVAGAAAGGGAGRAGAAGALGDPAAFDAGAPDAGIEGACAHVAGRDSWPARKRRVATAVQRVVRVIVSIMAVLTPGRPAFTNGT